MASRFFDGDRAVQAVAAVVVAACVAASAFLAPVVQQQRRDLQLDFTSQTRGGSKPTYAVLAAGLGSFRGLAVNALWYRAEMEKRAKRFKEANNLARWITELQPRFPNVWQFHAWNLAYNVSVETFTPQERWGWVKSGMELLRDEGIRWNPSSSMLYHELAWILFHKIGGNTDDMNWFYKAEMAREWQEVLGGPQDFMADDQAIEAMGRIASAADRYLAFERPEAAIADEIDRLAGLPVGGVLGGDPAGSREPVVPAMADLAVSMKRTPVLRLRDRVAALVRELEDGGQSDQSEAMAPLVTMLENAVTRAGRDPVSAFRAANPPAGAAIDRLRSAGFDLDAAALRAIGRVLLYTRYGGPAYVRRLPAGVIGERGLAMLDLLSDPSPEFAEGLRQLMPFLRAKVLLDDYNMDPRFMHRLMLRYGPADWRNPASHALYWYARGIDQAYNLRDATDISYTNTRRGILQSLQMLFQFGTVLYNPLMPRGLQTDLRPDLAFAESYGLALKEGLEEIASGRFGRVRAEVYENGYENYLQQVVEAAYLNGDLETANRFYTQLRTEFADSNLNNQYNLYEVPLQDFVIDQVQQGDGSLISGKRLIESLIQRGVNEGLAYGDINRANRLLNTAQAFHERYMNQRDYQAGYEGTTRIGLQPFPRMVEQAYTTTLSDARLPIVVRQNIYSSTPLPLIQRTYQQWIVNVAQQVDAEPGAAADAMARTLFPPPPDAVLDVPDRAGIDGGTTERR